MPQFIRLAPFTRSGEPDYSLLLPDGGQLAGKPLRRGVRKRQQREQYGQAVHLLLLEARLEL